MIRLDDVSVRFGEKRVLERVSLTLPETGVVTLSGPSGCGKTTLARVLAGLIRPDGGSVSGIVCGQAAFMFQEDRLLPWLSALENVAAVCPKETALRALSAVGLEAEADTLPERLSGGMRRRVALARALAYPSDLLILDEPFTGVDDALRERLYPLIRASAKAKPVLLITHHPGEIAALSDRTLTLSGPPLRILP